LASEKDLINLFYTVLILLINLYITNK